MEFSQPNKADSDTKLLYLFHLYHTGSPHLKESGYIYKKSATLYFGLDTVRI